MHVTISWLQQHPSAQGGWPLCPEPFVVARAGARAARLLASAHPVASPCLVSPCKTAARQHGSRCFCMHAVALTVICVAAVLLPGVDHSHRSQSLAAFPLRKPFVCLLHTPRSWVPPGQNSHTLLIFTHREADGTRLRRHQRAGNFTGTFQAVGDCQQASTPYCLPCPSPC